MRAKGLATIITDSYRRNGVVLRVGPGHVASTEDDQRRAAVAFEWLVNPGDVGVWLTACALPLVDRYVTWRLSVPGYPTRSRDEASTPTASRLSGACRPAPRERR